MIGRARTENRDVQYGGSDFRHASELVRALRYGHADRRLRPRPLAGGLLALMRVMTGLPTAAIRLSDSSAGHLINSRLQERHWGIPKNRVAQGILRLPESADEYRSGRRRQAMRTNVRRAGALGMTGHRIPSEERAAVTQSFFVERLRGVEDAQTHLAWWHGLLAAHNDEWCVRDRSGKPIALAVLVVDTETAMLRALLSDVSEARWLLHTCIVDALCNAGVRHLLTHSTTSLLLEPGQQNFQRLLGYTVAHLSVRTAFPRLGGG